jgi:transmembrane protein 231
MVEVYSEPLCERYYASRLSMAWATKAAYWVLLFVVPFFIAYNSSDFYVREKMYYEQPIVSFTKQVIVRAEGAGGDYITWSSIPEYNTAVGKSRTRAPSMVKSFSTDADLDFRNEEIDVRLDFPLRAGEAITSVTAVLFFSVQLADRLRLDTVAPVVVQASSAGSGSEVHVFGDLHFRQDNALSQNGVRDAYLNDILDPTQINDLQDVRLESIMQQVMGRNETFDLNYRPLWVHGEVPSFSVRVNVKVPPVPVRYVPNAAETLKGAFVQYVPFFLLVHYLLNVVLRFAFGNQLMETRVLRDTTPARKVHQF